MGSHESDRRCSHDTSRRERGETSCGSGRWNVHELKRTVGAVLEEEGLGTQLNVLSVLAQGPLRGEAEGRPTGAVVLRRLATCAQIVEGVAPRPRCDPSELAPRTVHAVPVARAGSIRTSDQRPPALRCRIRPLCVARPGRVHSCRSIEREPEGVHPSSRSLL